MALHEGERASAKTGGFPPSSRLLESRDFRRVMRTGRRRSNRDLVVISSPLRASEHATRVAQNSVLEDGQRSRLGITISRKVGNAVCRNRFKRRVRDWFRRARVDFDQEVELIVIARKSGGQLEMPDLDRGLRTLLGLPIEGQETTRSRRGEST